ncbi:hypothetical protein A3K92_09295 [Thermococcus gorgonarius]|uniref:Uncharacterized protein n=1 Tax=Thermococcus gorgonarius TaxID=71997 RepID=A0A2Z2MB42_THEGO|nr:hypothetical protein A3K92_09295 [Thermococcus gorgonarius]
MGNQAVVNLGIGSIILGIVAFSLPGWRCLPLDTRGVLSSSSCAFFSSLASDVGLKGKAFVIPPYENLPHGGIFIPVSSKGKPNLGRLFEGRVLYSEPEPGLLLSPVPGWRLTEDLDILGSGVGYASSAVSGVLDRLGLPGPKVFEEGENIEVYVEISCREFPYADPVLSAVLVALAAGAGEVLTVEDIGEVKGYLKLLLKRAGGVEKWL